MTWYNPFSWGRKSNTENTYFSNLKEIDLMISDLNIRLMKFYGLRMKRTPEDNLRQELRGIQEDWNLAYKKVEFVYNGSIQYKKELGRLIELMLRLNKLLEFFEKTGRMREVIMIRATRSIQDYIEHSLFPLFENSYISETIKSLKSDFFEADKAVRESNYYYSRSDFDKALSSMYLAKRNLKKFRKRIDKLQLPQTEFQIKPELINYLYSKLESIFIDKKQIDLEDEYSEILSVLETIKIKVKKIKA